MAICLGIVIGLIMFCAGFCCAALMAARKREDEEMDRAYMAAWKETE